MDAYCRLAATALAAALSTLAIACAPPSLDERVGDSNDGLTDGVGSGGGGEAAPTRPTRFHPLGLTRFNPRLGGVEEKVRINRRGDRARVCYAYLDGTDADKRACDAYPTNYVDMTCADKPSTSIADTFFDGSGPTGNELTTECTGLRAIGAAPLDKGDGRYQAHYVSVADPAARFTGEAVVHADLFTVILPTIETPFSNPTSSANGLQGPSPFPGYAPSEAPILFPFSGTLPDQLPSHPAPKPFARVSLAGGGLHITVEVRRDLASQVKGCATLFSTDGLSESEIDAKDAEAVADCASPNVPLDGLDGWTKNEGMPDAQRTQLTNDATAFLAPNRHIIVAFEVGGRVRPYVFFLVPGGRVGQ